MGDWSTITGNWKSIWHNTAYSSLINLLLIVDLATSTCFFHLTHQRWQRRFACSKIQSVAAAKVPRFGSKRQESFFCSYDYYFQILQVLALIKTTTVLYPLFILVITDFSNVTSASLSISHRGDPPSRPATQQASRLKSLTDVVHSLQSRHDVGSAESL